MTKLANYSVETDQVVLLSFADGSSRRVPVNQLAQHLGPADLQRVRAAIKMRQEFIRQHLPKALIALVVIGLATLLLVNNNRFAQLFRPPTSPSAPEDTHVVRNVLMPTPSPTPAQQQTLQTTTPATPTPTPGRRTARAKTAPSRRLAATAERSATKVKLPLLPITITLPSVTPIAPTPAPVADGTQPTPTASPTPIITPSPTPDVNGSVLGDSTGPESGQK